jgi:putative membrane protein
MSNIRFSRPARFAGLVSFCIAAAVSAQTTSGTASSSNANRPAATAGQAQSGGTGSSSMSANKSGATGSTAMGSNNATAKAPADSVSRGDRKFMEKAAQGGMAEVQLGKLAAEKASSDQVKKFAQQMVDDHSKANEQLKQIATTKGVNLPTEPDRSHQREMERLSKLSGADFDREYMKHMVSDHKKDVSEFKSEAGKAKDADLKQFAASTLPTLEQHLKEAQSTEKIASQSARDGMATSRTASNRKTGS